jgi:hypothetical protein
MMEPESGVQFEFDPTDVMQNDMVVGSDENLELPRDCSDNSASEDSSLTGSER